MIDVQHAKWDRPDEETGNKRAKRGSTTYDAFVNPDVTSSIAAVIVRRYTDEHSKTSIDVSLVPNNAVARDDVVQALWKRHGLAGLEYAPYEAVRDGLKSLHVDVPSSLTAVLVGQEQFHIDEESAKAHTAERLKHLVSTFRSTCVLSESVPVCLAFLEAMCGELEDVRAIYQPSVNKPLRN